MKYLILIEDAGTNFSAYAPDVPGCIATGSTPEEVQANMREALEFHFDGMRLQGEVIPQPSSTAAFVGVPEPVHST